MDIVEEKLGLLEIIENFEDPWYQYVMINIIPPWFFTDIYSRSLDRPMKIGFSLIVNFEELASLTTTSTVEQTYANLTKEKKILLEDIIKSEETVPEDKILSALKLSKHISYDEYERYQADESFKRQMKSANPAPRLAIKYLYMQAAYSALELPNISLIQNEDNINRIALLSVITDISEDRLLDLDSAEEIKQDLQSIREPSLIEKELLSIIRENLSV